jgi:hypothetical protein
MIHPPPRRKKFFLTIIRKSFSWLSWIVGLYGIVFAEARLFADDSPWLSTSPIVDTAPRALRQAGWPISTIDRYVLAHLEEASLEPNADAPPNVLIRRLYFDLIGLPPTSSEVDQFIDRVQTTSLEEAMDEVIESLMKRPGYGERWGRHWLDVARFGESSGKEANISFPYAWRYRDYVIDATQNDIPFNRFIEEQIAGDLLPTKNEDERARLLIATGFLAVGTKNLDEANPKQFEADIVDEQIDTISRAFMAHSVACARCHDHKTDPYSLADYYALAGIFASTKTYFGTAVSPANRVGGDPLLLPSVKKQLVFHPPITAKRVQELQTELASLKKEEAEGMAANFRGQMKAESHEPAFTLRDALRIFWTSGRIEGELEKYDAEGRPLPLAMGVQDRESMTDAKLLEGGDIHQPGETIARGLPQQASTKADVVLPETESGRRQLAQWLTNYHQALTARVMVNRLWAQVMGHGIVRTMDDFGATGEAPTHPELLDHLAGKLIENTWSIRRTLKYILQSRTYRQASTFRFLAYDQDPDNRMYWRANPRRLQAEAIRDAMLQVSGELDLNRPEGSLVAKVIGDQPISLIGLNPKVPSDLDGSRHRSVYLPILRDRLPDVLATFDFAEPSLVTGKRDVTNVPTQALYLMNSSFVMARANAMAKSIQAKFQQLDEPAIGWLYESCFARPATPEEVSMGIEYCSSFEDRARGLASYCQALLSSAEFRWID